jgi:hypothetical protein
MFARSPPTLGELSHRDKLAVTGDELTFDTRGNAPVSFRAPDVVAIWYDYNPFGSRHANSLRLVYTVGNGKAYIDVYDDPHTFEPLLSYLQQYFPASVASRYREFWGAPGGDEAFIQI